MIGAERLLTREALAQNEREFEYRRLVDERSQAALVGCETGYSALTVAIELLVSNDSSSAIWGVRWFLVIGDGITRQPEGTASRMLKLVSRQAHVDANAEVIDALSRADWCVSASC